ncbi:uncharacterized protein TNCV_33501 [Trichonephila clavipes]|nr:uncharacterized protein TNCV_33501 [Trichonephila clavipes]
MDIRQYRCVPSMERCEENADWRIPSPVGIENEKEGIAVNWTDRYRLGMVCVKGALWVCNPLQDPAWGPKPDFAGGSAARGLGASALDDWDEKESIFCPVVKGSSTRGEFTSYKPAFLQAARKLAQCTHRTRLKAAFKKALEKVDSAGDFTRHSPAFERFRLVPDLIRRHSSDFRLVGHLRCMNFEGGKRSFPICTKGDMSPFSPQHILQRLGFSCEECCCFPPAVLRHCADLWAHGSGLVPLGICSTITNAFLIQSIENV